MTVKEHNQPTNITHAETIEVIQTHTETHLKADEYIKSRLKDIPQSPGVYMMRDVNGTILYVGKAKVLPQRLRSYTDLKSLCKRIRIMVSKVTNLEYMTTKSEVDALILEASMIKSHKPHYNILLKDDKAWSFITLHRNHDFPGLSMSRRPTKDEHKFGPFSDYNTASCVSEVVKQVYGIRSCSDREFINRRRPCLEYQIKRCTAPCVNKISKEDYKDSISGAISLMKGKSKEILNQMLSEMNALSDDMEYEKAGQIKKKFDALSALQSRGKIHFARFDNTDAIIWQNQGDFIGIQVSVVRNGLNHGMRVFNIENDEQNDIEDVLMSFISQFYSNNPLPHEILLDEIGEESFAMIKAALSQIGKVKITIPKGEKTDKKMLIDFGRENLNDKMFQKCEQILKNKNLHTDLQNALFMDTEIERIEVYDNSHISGTDFLGVMIVANPDGFDSGSYRKFNAKESLGGDDYAMMYEVMKRRFSGHDPRPDLLIIDGGKGQGTSVANALRDLKMDKMPFLCVSKGPQRNKGLEEFFFYKNHDAQPQNVSIHGVLRHYLQRIRDESHRFAITANRLKRNKKIPKSPLDEIQGVGPKRKQILIKHFGGSKKILQATPKEIADVLNVSITLAQNILMRLNELSN